MLIFILFYCINVEMCPRVSIKVCLTVRTANPKKMGLKDKFWCQIKVKKTLVRISILAPRPQI